MPLVGQLVTRFLWDGAYGSRSIMLTKKTLLRMSAAALASSILQSHKYRSTLQHQSQTNPKRAAAMIAFSR